MLVEVVSWLVVVAFAVFLLWPRSRPSDVVRVDVPPPAPDLDAVGFVDVVEAFAAVDDRVRRPLEAALGDALRAYERAEDPAVRAAWLLEVARLSRAVDLEARRRN